MVLVAGRGVRNIVGGLVVPFFQVGVLVLQGVGQLVRHHRLLLVRIDPVEQVHGLGLGVVVGFDLLLEERQQKGLELEILVEQAEFLEHDFVALEALGAFVFVEFFIEILSTAARVVSWRLTVLLMGRPVSSDENLISSSTIAKSCLACSGVMWVAGLALSLPQDGWWLRRLRAGGWAGGGGLLRRGQGCRCEEKQDGPDRPRRFHCVILCCGFIGSPVGIHAPRGVWPGLGS